MSGPNEVGHEVDATVGEFVEHANYAIGLRERMEVALDLRTDAFPLVEGDVVVVVGRLDSPAPSSKSGEHPHVIAFAAPSVILRI